MILAESPNGISEITFFQCSRALCATLFILLEASECPGSLFGTLKAYQEASLLILIWYLSIPSLDPAVNPPERRSGVCTEECGDNIDNKKSFGEALGCSM